MQHLRRLEIFAANGGVELSCESRNIERCAAPDLTMLRALSSRLVQQHKKRIGRRKRRQYNLIFMLELRGKFEILVSDSLGQFHLVSLCVQVDIHLT